MKMKDRYKDRYIEEIFLVLTMVVMVLLIFAQVVGRYVFSAAPSWTEELARYIHIWQVWIGASYAIRLREHIKIEAFTNLFSTFMRKIFETLAIIVWFLLALSLAILGTQLVLSSMKNGQLTPAMQIPMWIPFLAIPLGGAGMSLRLIQQLWIIWRMPPEDHKEEGADLI
ncbi:TRAP transporter small permease [Cytobacillus purgationiresistens]|uniref:TRAP-type C4-dicarboxylate transport system permease small subunit n=1 Tax=Cytobacillus purgationiresistens TaxID=863449 RepID=A0ABU0APC8_9BACI|nr:TRAP transporter small permease [Cytobacillus purgationiresistens]MDQ0273131.1 TRAP-type C4-dicarboxylate transport system permease small subunit [Cytobacillus purgationiresistens]